MYKSHRILGLIPARGGSKGIPRKNIVDLCGKPLIAWTIQSALESEFIDDVIVTTDDDEIAEVSKKSGAFVPFIRPSELAQDETGSSEVVIHALSELQKVGKQYDVFVLLQPTSPFRETGLIDEMIAKCAEEQVNTVVSIANTSCYLEKVFTLKGGKVERLVENKVAARQSCTPLYKETGSVYVARVEIFEKTLEFISGKSSFKETFGPTNIDIDNFSDLETARKICENLFLV